MSESALRSSIPEPLLGVACSTLGRRWLARGADPLTQAMGTAIAQAHGIPEILARVLAGRGVGVADVPAWLEPRLRDLMPDPCVLRDMEAAAERLARAVVRREPVAVFGDYDVDGACSAALLAGFLQAEGVPVAIHIPDRLTEGYGPNVEAIRALRQGGASLLVTVDCGTSGHEPLAEAARLGLDTVVLDHHQSREVLPEAVALVNPNRLDDLSGLGHLCAAGIVFLTLVALNRVLRRRGYWNGRAEPDLLAGLDLVALATVADVVPLQGLNRAFVRQGLTVMRRRGRVGLAALFDAAGLARAPECWHLGYLLGPRINAGGRIGDSALGTRLLLARDPVEAGRLAATLDGLNRERQAIEAAAVAEAEAEAERLLAEDPERPVLVTASPGWHPGVVGLVAARLKERFGRPAFALAIHPDGGAVGSARSIAGVDVGAAVAAAVAAGAAAKGGGHPMAAGVTLAPEGVGPFGAFLAERLAGPVRAARGETEFWVDGTLTAGGATPELVTALERAGPFGSGAPEPVFAFPRHRLTDPCEVGAGHVRARLRAGDGAIIPAVAFRAAGQTLGRALAESAAGELHVAGSLCLDRWNGRERVELRICDVAPVC